MPLCARRSVLACFRLTFCVFRLAYPHGSSHSVSRCLWSPCYHGALCFGGHKDVPLRGDPAGRGEVGGGERA